MSAAVTVACAQTTMTQSWKVQADDVESSYIISTTLDQCRGMYLNKTVATGGSLLVASRTANALIRRLDPETGQLKDPAVMPGGYSGTATTLGLNKVVVTDDGIIYAGSVGQAGASEQHFRIYRHNDEFSGPELVADVRTDNAGLSMRLGDDMDVVGTGNNTKILVSGYQAAGLAVFTTADNGMTFTATKITCSPALVGNGSISWDPDSPNRFWYRDNTPGIYRAYDITGNTATGLSGAGNELPGAPGQQYCPFDIGNVHGVKSVILGIGASAATTNGKPIRVYDLANLSETYLGYGSEFQPGGSKANGNAAGDVYLDSVNNHVYVLYTNNSITKYSIPVSDVKEWGQY